MMNDPWKLMVFWRPREESAAGIAERLHQFLDMASAICPNLGRWFEQVRSSKSKLPTRAINDYNLVELEKLIRKNRFNDDFGNPMSFGGYVPSFWNGQPYEQAASIIIFAGLKGTLANYYMCNRLSFSLCTDLAAHGLGTDDALKRFLEAIIIAWDPDWAVLFRSDSPTIQDCDRGAPYLDKMAWVGPARLAEAAHLAGPGVTVDVLGGGALYTRLHPPEIP